MMQHFAFIGASYTVITTYSFDSKSRRRGLTSRQSSSFPALSAFPILGNEVERPPPANEPLGFAFWMTNNRDLLYFKNRLVRANNNVCYL